MSSGGLFVIMCTVEGCLSRVRRASCIVVYPSCTREGLRLVKIVECLELREPRRLFRMFLSVFFNVMWICCMLG